MSPALRGAATALIAWFRWHARAYGIAVAAFVALLVAGAPWRWAFWPLLVWSLVMLLHYLVYKSATVDERWAAARTEELHLKSYDRGHIQSIRARESGSDPADDARRVADPPRGRG